MEDSSHHEEAPPFRVVVTRYPPEDLAEALAEGIVSGHPDMPEFVFQPDEIEAILAYLGTLMPPSDAAPDERLPQTKTEPRPARSETQTAPTRAPSVFVAILALRSAS